MKNYSIYVRIDEEQNLVHTSGVIFKEFVKGLNIANKDYLILAGFPNNCSFNMNLLLEYVPKEMAEAFINENVYHYGDFCWVDYTDKQQLEYLTNEELAELLYMSHKKEPLHCFKIKSLNNKYAYLCHDDGWWNNVYMENVSEYKGVLSYKLMQEFKGRKRTISEPQEELMDKIYEMCKEGLVMDFEKKTDNGVNLFCVGEISTMDDLENKMHRYRNKSNGLSIYYDTRKKLWVYF